MLWIIILFIFCIFGIIYNWEETYWGERIGMFTVSILGSIIIGLLVSLLVGVFIPIKYMERVEYNNENIYSIVDNRDISGHFALGSGVIDTQPTYYYIIKTDLGEKIETKPIKYSYITYTEEQPTLKTYCYTYKNIFLKLIAENQKVEYIFNVPKDTINYNYEIDLK